MIFSFTFLDDKAATNKSFNHYSNVKLKANYCTLKLYEGIENRANFSVLRDIEEKTF